MLLQAVLGQWSRACSVDRPPRSGSLIFPCIHVVLGPCTGTITSINTFICINSINKYPNLHRIGPDLVSAVGLRSVACVGLWKVHVTYPGPAHMVARNKVHISIHPAVTCIPKHDSATWLFTMVAFNHAAALLSRVRGGCLTQCMLLYTARATTRRSDSIIVTTLDCAAHRFPVSFFILCNGLRTFCD